MSVNWDNAQIHLDHYLICIRTKSPLHPISGLPVDPANANGERIGEWVSYGKHFALYAECYPPNPLAIPYYFYLKRVARLVQFLATRGLQTDHRILIVGCGFGFFVYCFRHASWHPNIADDYPLTYGIDSSAYIASNWDSQRIGDEDFVNDDWTLNNIGRVRNALDAMTGGFHTFHIVINFATENYNPVTDVAELSGMFDACERGLVGTDYRRIIHVIDNELLTRSNGQPEDGTEEYYQTHRDYGTTLMTLEDWAALKPTHSWIGARSEQVIVGVLA